MPQYFRQNPATSSTIGADLGINLSVLPVKSRAACRPLSALGQDPPRGPGDQTRTMSRRSTRRELITDVEAECYVPAGYPGRVGELWFVPLCPPIEPVAYHIADTIRRARSLA